MRELSLDPAYISRILKAFREQGLIESRRCDTDKRSQKLSLTAAGKAARNALAERSRQQLAKDLDGLSPDARQRLIQAIAVMRDSFSDTEQPAPIVLRAHRPGDIGWVISAQAEFYTSSFGWNDRFEALAAEVASKFLANFNPQREKAWIAEREGERLGSIFIADGGDNIAKLRLLYVAPSARGAGLGKTLVAEAIEFSRRTGYRQVSLWTNDNLDVARAIYIKQGFRLVAEEKHTMFGPELNGQTWVLDL
jgi:GNAT superfamily N-acetyltransferase